MKLWQRKREQTLNDAKKDTHTPPKQKPHNKRN